jgi:putative endonuclease
MRTPAQLAGDAAEAAVVTALTGAGWTVLGRNVRVGRAELDVIARDPGPPPALVFVEVRWRRRRDFGLPEETVDWRKRGRLHQAAWRWLEISNVPRDPLRFDLVVVEPGDAASGPRLRHHRSAF